MNQSFALTLITDRNGHASAAIGPAEHVVRRCDYRTDSPQLREGAMVRLRSEKTGDTIAEFRAGSGNQNATMMMTPDRWDLSRDRLLIDVSGAMRGQRCRLGFIVEETNAPA